MQSKVTPNKPLLVLLYGYPGSGKSAFARQFAEEMTIVHIEADRFQHELHETTHGQASGIASTLLQYMTKEFLRSGVSVILDASLTRKPDRKLFKHIAKTTKAEVVLVWIQIDAESAYTRIKKRDRRKTEDRFANEYSASDFQAIINESQNPDGEDYIVISGKHTFNTQRGAVMKKLYEVGVLTREDANQKVVKPGLVNLIPQHFSPRGEFPRRNISIR